MSQESLTSGWYYSKAGSSPGSEVGPLSWEDLYLLARAGTVEPNDILWNPRLPRGMAAGTLPELFPDLPTDPAPPAQAHQIEPQTRPEPEPVSEPIAPEPMEASDEAPMAGTEAGKQLDEAFATTFGDATSPSEPPETREQGQGKRARRARPERQSNSLPVLVVLLVLVIAAAAVVTYFLYFR